MIWYMLHREPAIVLCVSEQRLLNVINQSVQIRESIRQLQRIVDAEDVVAFQVVVHQNFESVLDEPPEEAVYPDIERQYLGIVIRQSNHILVVHLSTKKFKSSIL